MTPTGEYHVFWTPHPHLPLAPFHLGERVQTVKKQVNLNIENLGPEQLDSDTGLGRQGQERGSPMGNDA